MEEIAQQFREELQELLDRYKIQMSVPRIMNIAQDVFHKTLSFRYHPELHNLTEEHIRQIVSSGPSFMEKYNLKKEIAEASCDEETHKERLTKANEIIEGLMRFCRCFAPASYR